MDFTNLEASIRDWEAERDRLHVQLAQLEPLVQRLDAIESYLTAARALLPVMIAAPSAEQQKSAPEPTSEKITPAPASFRLAASTVTSVLRKPKAKPATMTMWQGAHAVLSAKRQAMRVPDIAKAMIEEHGWHPFHIEQLRTAMTRRDDVFDALGNGYFALTEWPEEMKKVA